MKNKIAGVIAVIWGGGVLARHFLADSEPVGGAYEAGQNFGLVLGALLMLAGLVALLKKPKEA